MQPGAEDFEQRMSNQFTSVLQMDRDRELLPWIMGALFAIFAAFAIAVTLSHRASPHLAAPNARVAAAAIPVPPPAAQAPPTPQLAAPAAAATVAPAAPRLPSGQVWECVVNGEHTFAGSPCGPNASIRQLNAVNTMEAARIVRSAPYSDQSYQPEFYPQSGPVNDQAPVVLVGRAPFYEHRRHDHPPPHQTHASPVFR